MQEEPTAMLHICARQARTGYPDLRVINLAWLLTRISSSAFEALQPAGEVISKAVSST